LFQEFQGVELSCDDDALAVAPLELDGEAELVVMAAPLLVAPADVQPCDDSPEDPVDAEAEEDHAHEVPNWTVVDASLLDAA
jgi:hypothetical protein